jgi:hypothetical protein
MLTICLLFLFGCQQSASVPSKLDTSLLQKEKAIGLATSDLKKHTPIAYTTKSTDQALKALPWSMSLPKIPFDSRGYTNIYIADQQHDGKQIDFSTTAFSADAKNILSITANNHGGTYSLDTPVTIKLTAGITGKYREKTITFRKKGINYLISLKDSEKNNSIARKELISLANQTIK